MLRVADFVKFISKFLFIFHDCANSARGEMVAQTLSLNFVFFCRGHATYKPPCRSVRLSVGLSVGLLVGLSVGPSHFAFFAFLGILRVEKFVFEHAPAQIITAPAQIIIAPAQPSATGAVVYTALFFLLFLFLCHP